MTLDIDLVRTSLFEKFNLSIEVTQETSPAGQLIHVAPEDLSEHNGFEIETLVGWRSVRSVFKPGNFAQDLLNEMGLASEEQKACFLAFAKSTVEDGGKISMKINGREADLFSPNNWPTKWETLELDLIRSPVLFDHNDDSKLSAEALTWITRMFGMAVSLIPKEEEHFENKAELVGMPEGALTRVEANRYERSSINRTACIEANGNSCMACGFDFGKNFGSMGMGFIHVHHIVPVSQMSENYMIDPVKDLVPVCPNCHAMLHRETPPLSVDALKEILIKQDED